MGIEKTPRLTTAVRDLAEYLGVPLPPGLGPVRPRLRRQADQHTERLVERFLGARRLRDRLPTDPETSSGLGAE